MTVDKMIVDKMTVAKMTVSKMIVNKMTCGKIRTTTHLQACSHAEFFTCSSLFNYSRKLRK